MELHHPQLQAMADELYEFSAGVFYKRGRIQGRTIIIYGANGCGKTHAVRQFCKWFNHCRMAIGPVVTATQEGENDAKIPDAKMVSWPVVVDGFKKEQWLVCDDLENEYLALIDDVGAEHDPSGIGIEKLYTILNRREFRHTLITTNIHAEQWEKKFERRIVSRFYRNALHIDLSQVPDYNTK